MAKSDDADRIARPRRSHEPQEARTKDPAAIEPGTHEAAVPGLDAAAADGDRLLRERRAATAQLMSQLNNGKLTPAEYMAEIGKLWSTPPAASAQQILDAMLEWTARANPDPVARERLFGDALRRLKERDSK